MADLEADHRCKRTLKLPNFFIQNHDFTMYSNDVEFLNGLMNTKTRGRVLYHLTLSLWRLLCLCYYAEARLEVLKLTKHIEDKSIKARWRIRGLPIYSLLLRFYRKDKSQLYRTYDAFSTFYIGRDGLINCHKVEKSTLDAHTEEEAADEMLDAILSKITLTRNETHTVRHPACVTYWVFAIINHNALVFG
ncbi:hypothetical protein F2P81_001336 [Scophthalmus maximus]|uniref:Uncharacterized protein n=1 Tax=Scophthalmus maximus TaxID=52904 RepID=A0A6A4TNE3_SCOMX|nr:hypothetical protein F2P81_001336 [Scophthalmus maximus]